MCTFDVDLAGSIKSKRPPRRWVVGKIERCPRKEEEASATKLPKWVCAPAAPQRADSYDLGPRPYVSHCTANTAMPIRPGTLGHAHQRYGQQQHTT